MIGVAKIIAQLLPLANKSCFVKSLFKKSWHSIHEKTSAVCRCVGEHVGARREMWGLEREMWGIEGKYGAWRAMLGLEKDM